MIHQTIRVALIEDNVTDAARVRNVLLRPKDGTDFRFEHFTNLKSGIERLQNVHFDVLLLDLGLPGSKGLRTLSKVVAAVPRLPILVLADADVSPGVLETIRNDGRLCFSKPRMSAEALVEGVLLTAMGVTVNDGHHAIPSSTDVVTGTPIRVLIIEDDHGDLAAIRFLLASVRSVLLAIRHAPNLFSALDLLDHGHGTDVVLLDLTLPDSQGLETLQQIRGKDPSTPVIILARPEDRPMAVEALGQGAQDYVVKGQVDGYLLGQTIMRRVAPQAMGQAATSAETPRRG